MAKTTHNGVTRILNWRPGPQGIAKLKVHRARMGKALPPVFSMRKVVTILDQGEHGTCTANSRADAIVAAQGQFTELGMQ